MYSCAMHFGVWFTGVFCVYGLFMSFTIDTIFGVLTHKHTLRAHTHKLTCLCIHDWFNCEYFRLCCFILQPNSPKCVCCNLFHFSSCRFKTGDFLLCSKLRKWGIWNTLHGVWVCSDFCYHACIYVSSSHPHHLHCNILVFLKGMGSEKNIVN